MQLSLQEYQSLLEMMRPYGLRRPGEKRLHVRVGADAQVTIIPLAAGARPAPILVHVTDVSRHGIAIRHSRPFNPGQQFILCLSLIGGKRTRPVLCAVRRIKPIGDQLFQMGCEFTSHTHPDVPTDQILPGLKKFQVKQFAAEEQALYRA